MALEETMGSFIDRVRLQAKYDAINEYHEKVKQTLINNGFYPAIVKNVLEDVKKEMVGE